MPRLPSVDPLSFWLGFIAASLFWWLLSRLRPLLPALVERVRHIIRAIRERNLSGANDFIRKDVVQQAQRWHITANLFPLDEILIPPKLLAPPYIPFPDSPPKPEPLCEQIIPYLPDWPELSSRFAYPRISLAEALNGGAHIAVIGQPGSGKTVCLAHLACQVARRETATGALMDYAPLLFHIRDLQVDDQQDPLSAFYRPIATRAPAILKGQVKRLIIERFREGKALMVIDGLDELHPDETTGVARFFINVLEKYPGNKLAVAASPDWINGLAEFGIVPLALTAWGNRERKDFLRVFSDAWNEKIAPQATRQANVPSVSPVLVGNWLTDDLGFFSPLEWTLKVWGAYSGDLRGPTKIGAMETYLARLTQGLVTRPIMEKLAHEYVARGQSAIRYQDLDRLLTEQTGPRQPTVLSQDESETDQTGSRTRKQGRRDIILSPGEQILEHLISAGLLCEHAGDLVRFSCPAFAGILTATQVTLDELGRALAEPGWTLHSMALHYLAARSTEASWIEDFIFSDASPLARNLQLASRWLADAAPAAAWKPQLFRAMASLVQDDTLPEGLRARVIAGFACSNDPVLPRFFKQLFASHSPVTRRLSLIGAGAWADPAMTQDITALLADPVEPVRLAACIALGAIQTESSLNILAEALMNSDENMRQAAAEAIAYIPGTGHDIIKEAAEIDDILTRRAAVFGLLQIRTPWATQLLEKIAIQDGQWVVRNVATQALEALQEADQHIPHPLPKPWDCGWLIAFASKKGTGVAPNVPAHDLIHQVLTTGGLDEQLGALEYAKTILDDRIIQDVYQLFYSGQSSISEAALYTIWYWSISGVKLPEPHKVV